MSLEQKLTLSSRSVDGDTDAVPSSNGGGDDGGKATRLPRWTRQEILVLIQGKRVAENRVRRGRRVPGLAIGSGQVEPKWASVSSYCKRHGVNRGPVQCRKRWSNLAGDYKKIKEWESQIRDESESFWVMRNDLRRERKLPGFFDKEVYDILDGGSTPASVSVASPVLALALVPVAAVEEDERYGGERTAGAGVESDDVAAEAVFDSGRSAAADDGLFSDFEQSDKDEMGRSLEKAGPSPAQFHGPMPISEKQQYRPFTGGGVTTGRGNEKQPSLKAEFASTSQDTRKRFTTEGDAEAANLQDQLIKVMERNSSILHAQLEAQNTNLRLDREERKDHTTSLVAVLSKVADALGRIADRL